MTLIHNKYRLLQLIGAGCFGEIYKGQNMRTHEYVAIKIEPISSNFKLLKNESIFYQHLKNCEGIPRVKWYGKDDINYYMVIDLLGNSLQYTMDKMGKFSLLLVLKIGIKVINIIKQVHEKGIIHRDIKPDNFLFGPNNINSLYLIDFGFCKSYLDANYAHIRQKPISNIIGSNNYASIASHKHVELSRRDDLESIAYMLLYFFAGRLPWNNASDNGTIIDLKQCILNDKQYPLILLSFLQYARTIEFDATPNYSFIINQFRQEIEILSKTN